MDGTISGETGGPLLQGTGSERVPGSVYSDRGQFSDPHVAGLKWGSKVAFKAIKRTNLDPQRPYFVMEIGCAATSGEAGNRLAQPSTGQAVDGVAEASERAVAAAAVCGVRSCAGRLRCKTAAYQCLAARLK